MRCRIAVGLLLFEAMVGAGATATSPRPQRHPADSVAVEPSVQLLDEAYRTSQEFPVDQRAWLILDAVDVAAQHHPIRAQKWALEVWKLSMQLSLGQDRIALQKDALRDLAFTNAGLALKLYRKQDLPSAWDAVHQTTEDARAFGYAGTIFKPLWEQHGRPYLRRLENLARFLGATGQYPYAAMSRIALDISASERRPAENILRDAVSCFPRDPGFVTSRQEFVKFILATRGIATSRILRDELNVAVTALENPPEAFAKQLWQVTVTTPQGPVNFDSQNEALLFELLPSVRDAMPARAADLLNRHPRLRGAPALAAGTPVSLSGVVSLAGKKDAARMQARLDESRVYKVQVMGTEDPKQALSIAEQIGDPYLRTLALVSLAPAYSGIDSRQADSWLSDAGSRLISVTDDDKQLQLMASIVHAQVAMGKVNEADSLWRHAFDLGEAIFTLVLHSSPAKPAESLAGYDQLADLTVSLTKSPVYQTATIARIRTVKNDLLRSALLVSAAKGLAGD